MTLAQNQSGINLKRYLTDFGREFETKLFQTRYEKNGIQWEPSAPYSPEPNRKADRLNYTLMSSVCSILSTMKLPKSLWLEVLKTVAYLKYQSPSIDGITFFEHLNGTDWTCVILKLLTLVLGWINQRKRDGSGMKDLSKRFLWDTKAKINIRFTVFGLERYMWHKIWILMNIIFKRNKPQTPWN